MTKTLKKVARGTSFAIAVFIITLAAANGGPVAAQQPAARGEMTSPAPLTGVERARQIYAEILGPWTLIELEGHYRQRDAARWEDLHRRWEEVRSQYPETRVEGGQPTVLTEPNTAAIERRPSTEIPIADTWVPPRASNEAIFLPGDDVYPPPTAPGAAWDEAQDGAPSHSDLDAAPDKPHGKSASTVWGARRFLLAIARELANNRAMIEEIFIGLAKAQADLEAVDSRLLALENDTSR